MSEPNIVADWFSEWLAFHQKCHPRGEWIQLESNDGPEVYKAWIEMFTRHGITLEWATKVTRHMQECSKVGYPDRQLGEIKGHFYALREREKERAEKYAATDWGGSESEEARAWRDSVGCPECTDEFRKPRGFARRRMVYRDFARFPYALYVDLYCRCPLGRYRERTAPDRHAGEGRAFADLQSLPGLWDSTRDHAMFDAEPGRRPDYVDDGIIMFLSPQDERIYNERFRYRRGQNPRIGA